MKLVIKINLLFLAKLDIKGQCLPQGQLRVDAELKDAERMLQEVLWLESCAITLGIQEDEGLGTHADRSFSVGNWLARAYLDGLNPKKTFYIYIYII